VLVASTSGTQAATGNSSVSATVVSSVSLTNGCTNSAGYDFGQVFLGSSNTTATGAGICTIGWQSNNDTSMLRMYQSAQGAGPAMRAEGVTFAQQLKDSTGSQYDAVSAKTASQVYVVGKSVAIASANGGASWTAGTCSSCTFGTLNGVQA